MGVDSRSLALGAALRRWRGGAAASLLREELGARSERFREASASESARHAYSTWRRLTEDSLDARLLITLGAAWKRRRRLGRSTSIWRQRRRDLVERGCDRRGERCELTRQRLLRSTALWRAHGATLAEQRTLCDVAAEAVASRRKRDALARLALAAQRSALEHALDARLASSRRCWRVKGGSLKLDALRRWRGSLQLRAAEEARWAHAIRSLLPTRRRSSLAAGVRAWQMAIRCG